MLQSSNCETPFCSINQIEINSSKTKNTTYSKAKKLKVIYKSHFSLNDFIACTKIK